MPGAVLLTKQGPVIDLGNALRFALIHNAAGLQENGMIAKGADGIDIVRNQQNGAPEPAKFLNLSK